MPTPHRCGKAAVFTFDHDALEMLPLMAPSRKAQGRFLSELIRQEVIRREERQKFLAELAAQGGVAELLPGDDVVWQTE